MMTNNTVLITGGAKRIGNATAQYLHGFGYNIIITYNKSVSSAKKLAQSLNNKRADSCKIIKASFSSKTNFKKLSRDLISLFGRIDVLVNNASQFYPTKIDDINTKKWDDLMNANLKSPLFLSQCLSKELKKRKGCIVNIIDIHIDPPLKDHIIYNISKAGLLALTKSLAKELAPNIRVNGVSPGAIMWAEADENKSSKKKEILSRIALRKSGNPLDIAKAVKFLISDSGYITGQNINVDGGRKLNM
tara:strand:- start:404 stop:1144 length:741 start_codon:yes stop_codon:yes gene_type:complete